MSHVPLILSFLSHCPSPGHRPQAPLPSRTAAGRQASDTPLKPGGLGGPRGAVTPEGVRARPPFQLCRASRAAAPYAQQLVMGRPLASPGAVPSQQPARLQGHPETPEMGQYGGHSADAARSPPLPPPPATRTAQAQAPAPHKTPQSWGGGGYKPIGHQGTGGCPWAFRPVTEGSLGPGLSGRGGATQRGRGSLRPSPGAPPSAPLGSAPCPLALPCPPSTPEPGQCGTICAIRGVLGRGVGTQKHGGLAGGGSGQRAALGSGQPSGTSFRRSAAGAVPAPLRAPRPHGPSAATGTQPTPWLPWHMARQGQGVVLGVQGEGFSHVPRQRGALAIRAGERSLNQAVPMWALKSPRCQGSVERGQPRDSGVEGPLLGAGD